MTATRITYSVLLSQAWQNIYAILNDKSKVADPLGPSGNVRKMVYSRFPDVKAIDFIGSGFPFIVVKPARKTQGNKSVDRKHGFISWELSVEIYASDRGPNNDAANGMALLDQLRDSIEGAFLSTANLDTLSANGMHSFKVNDVQEDVSELNNALVYFRELKITAMSRMVLSS